MNLFEAYKYGSSPISNILMNFSINGKSEDEIINQEIKNIKFEKVAKWFFLIFGGFTCVLIFGFATDTYDLAKSIAPSFFDTSDTEYESIRETFAFGFTFGAFLAMTTYNGAGMFARAVMMFLGKNRSRELLLRYHKIMNEKTV